jgi:hypothetical protein
LNPTTLIPAAQSDALLQEIERQTHEECLALAASAEREARALVSDARAAARKRMHDAIEELRREGARRLARAEAQRDTEARLSAQQSAVAVIARAWPLLVDALVARWHDPVGQTAWAEATARHARDRLRVDTWVVEHPIDWSADAQRRFGELLDGRDGAVRFEADRNLSAGLRIKAAGATLDATAQGLLADRPAVAGMLLAEIDAGAAREPAMSR